MQEAFDKLMVRPGWLLAALGVCVVAEWIIVTPLGRDWIPGLCRAHSRMGARRGDVAVPLLEHRRTNP